MLFARISSVCKFAHKMQYNTSYNWMENFGHFQICYKKLTTSKIQRFVILKCILKKKIRIQGLSHNGMLNNVKGLFKRLTFQHDINSKHQSFLRQSKIHIY